MYTPPLDQEAIKKRATDIEDMRKRFDAFQKQVLVKITMIENANAGLMNKQFEYEKILTDFSKSMKDMGSQIFDLMAAHDVFEKSLISLSNQFNDLSSRKLDLAGKIMAAKKRLDETGKSQ